MQLRQYQIDAISSIYNYFSENSGNPIIALPTGTGKSVVIGEFIRSIFNQYPYQRIMMLTHVKELIEQNLQKLHSLWPTAPAGIYSAGIGRKEIMPITFGGIASIAKLAPEKIGHIDLLLIDECHLVSHRESTMYQTVIKGLKEINPHLKIIGLTATPYRLNLGYLTEGGIFTDICFDLTSKEAFNKLIEDGYLSPLIPRKTNMEYDVSKVGTLGGEFKEKELQETVNKDELTYKAIQEIIELGKDRNHWLIFASGIEHGERVTDCLENLGISACCIHSKISAEQRNERIAGFKSGKYIAAVNNNVLTTGFDFPEIDLIGMLRPTKSPGLWVQMLGRGTRPAPGKNNCLVLDFAGNTRRLGPINDPVLPRRPGEKANGTAPVKVCEQCSCYNHAAARNCQFCGWEFPKYLKIKMQSYTDELIAKSENPIIEKYSVNKIIYHKNQKEGKTPTLRVTYFSGLHMFKEWICFEHDGFAKHKAKEWWKQRSYEEIPLTIDESLKKINELKTPKFINVWINKKFPEIMSYEF